VAQAIANAEADITHIDMGEERATDHARMRLLINVRDRLQLAEVLRALHRSPTVLRASRVKP
jgi:GTP pyrophosphokinase/guanosine-3',5'-bis(diphosphate) 3'-pyrophosphohydrolase